MVQILKYTRGPFDDDTLHYQKTYTAAPLVERYSGTAVLPGTAGGGESVGGGSTSKIGPAEIAAIVAAIEQTEWCKFVKSVMRKGQNLHSPEEINLDVPRENYGRGAVRPSVADRLQLGPPSFPGDRVQRYAKEPAAVRPKPEPLGARLSRPPAEVASWGAEVERYRKAVAETPRTDHYKRQQMHAALCDADARYRESRRVVAEYAAKMAVEYGISYDEAKRFAGGGDPLPLVPSCVVL